MEKWTKTYFLGTSQQEILLKATKIWVTLLNFEGHPNKNNALTNSKNNIVCLFFTFEKLRVEINLLILILFHIKCRYFQKKFLVFQKFCLTLSEFCLWLKSIEFPNRRAPKMEKKRNFPPGFFAKTLRSARPKVDRRIRKTAPASLWLFRSCCWMQLPKNRFRWWQFQANFLEGAQKRQIL